MTVKIEEATRKKVAVFVPEALQKAVDSYHEFMQRNIGEKAKDFSEHHAAGKVALAHIDLLLKLAKWANVETGDAGVAAQQALQGEDEANAFRRKEFHEGANNVS